MTRGSDTQVRTFTYDSTTQRISSIALPETGTTSFSYYGDGTLYRRTDAKNQIVQYAYDSYQRPTMIQRFLSSGIEDQLQRVTFTYDMATNGWGRVGQINWQTGGGMQFAYNYAYTAAGLATSKKMTVTKTRGTYTQTGQLETTYSYDNEGKLASMVYPTERLEGPAYPGQYRYLSPPATGLTYNYTYDSLGRPVARGTIGVRA